MVCGGGAKGRGCGCDCVWLVWKIIDFETHYCNSVTLFSSYQTLNLNSFESDQLYFVKIMMGLLKINLRQILFPITVYLFAYNLALYRF